MLQVSGRLVLARFFAAGLTLLLQIVLARWVGAEELGIYVIATSFAAVLAIFATMGFDAITGRFVARYRVKECHDLLAGFRISSLRHLLGASVALSGGFIVVILFLPELVPTDLRTSFILGVIAAPIIGLMRINGAFANVSRCFQTGFLPDILMRPSLQLSLFVVLAWSFAESSVQIALYAFILAAILAALAQAALIKRWGILPDDGCTPGFETKLWRGAGLTMMVAAVLVNQIAEIDVLLLSGLLGHDQIAVFNVCFRLVAFVSFGIYAVYQTMLPDLSEAYARADWPEVQLVISRANFICVCGALIALVGLFVVGRFVLGLFGNSFLAGYASLILLGCAQTFVAGVGPGAQLLMIAGFQNRCMIAYGTGLGCTVALNFLLVPSLGLEGAIYALVTGMVTSSLLLWYFARRHLELDVSICSPLRQYASLALSSAKARFG